MYIPMFTTSPTKVSGPTTIQSLQRSAETLHATLQPVRRSGNDGPLSNKPVEKSENKSVSDIHS